MFMSDIRKCMFRLCVYLLGIYRSFYVNKLFQVCLQLIITDQRDFLNGFFGHNNGSEEMGEEKKEPFVFSFSNYVVYCLSSNPFVLDL